MDIAEIKKLIKLFESSTLSEMELEKEGQRVLLRKGGGHHAPAPVARQDTFEEAPAGQDSVPEPAAEAKHSAVEDITLTGHVIPSPMVGTFFRAPSPTSPPYVDVGDHVRKGQVLCLVEAMKLMNEIESDIDGKITRILQENGKPVEYGQPLFEISPA
ncbi:MAG: acetyl-CoA carboxylase biotin carboxyl carrier protein [Nitrospinota bacterium]|nr:acetyl-CoA carboxylase biotin carboxyl carrier protein [Nitrospinota bacterium]